MNKTMLLVAILASAFAIGHSHGQQLSPPQTTIYGPGGAVVGRETRSGNSTTLYGPSGTVQGRSSTDSQGTTTYYDAQGRVTGKSNNEAPAK